MANENRQPQAIPEHEIKQNSGMTASMALQAAQKAWDLRQAANAAGDPDAREKILAKAINKEIEAESFGKAAKYTRSGAFQGLAAGAGLGVQPGVTIGKLTGALVGGVVSTVTGLLGGGIGSVYGAMNGPFWDLGEMASQGVRGVVGDFPNWKSTPSQQKALEKMVMQTKNTQAPTKEELEQMKKDAPDVMPQSWSQKTSEMTSWQPSMPSMPNMPSMPSAKGAGTALGLGGLGSSMSSWTGGSETQTQHQAPTQADQTQTQSQSRSQQPKQASEQKSKQKSHTPQAPTEPKEAHTPQKTRKIEKIQAQREIAPTNKSLPTTAEKDSEPRASTKPAQAKQVSHHTDKENKSPEKLVSEKKKPRKLSPKNDDVKPSQTLTPTKKAPRKLEPRKHTASTGL